MCSFSKVMPSSSRTESTSKYISIIITDSSTPRKRPSMCAHLNPTKLKFVREMRQIMNPRIQPLVLMNIERPENLTVDKIKYEFSKPFCPPSKADFGSDEEWATEPAPDFMAQQLINESEYQKKVCIKGIL